MLTACFMVCGGEKYCALSASALPSSQWDSALQKVKGLLILSLSETSHSTADLDAARASSSNRQAEGLQEIYFPSLIFRIIY